MMLTPTAPGTYRQAFPIHYPDADAAGFLRLTSLLNLLQIQAGDHSLSLGFDYRHHRDAGVFWVLSRLSLRVDQWPAWPCSLTVDTWARSTKAVFALRDFRFGTETAGWTGLASSAWVILKDRKPQRPEPWISLYVQARPEEPLAEMPPALPLFTEPAPTDSSDTPVHRTIGHVRADWEDVDMNGHVNNVNAVGWCLAQHDLAFLSRWRPEVLDVNFLAEMFCDQRFQILCEEGPATDGRRTFDYQVSREEDRTATLRLRITYR